MNEAKSPPPIPAIFLKPYNPSEHEDSLYRAWEKSGYFNPDICVQKDVTAPESEPFSIVLPPPNVTGTLHMGHAAMLAVEDTLVRFARMREKRALWLPGTDSAAIATQSKVESELYKKEGKTRHDLGREEFLKRVDAFAEASKNTIVTQTKKLGASLDWSRYAFTLDAPRYRAVMEAFIRMYGAGLIYRGARIVNWDPKLQTTVSDDEIEYTEETTPFYYFKYGPFEIGTVRPETKFGDKYVVMHPEDARYKSYSHGQKIKLEWINGPITATVIKDEAADPELGSGVMTITPAHSLVDFEIAQRHGLDSEPVIDEGGFLLPLAGEFAGMHIKKARAAIVEKMRAKGLLARVDEKYKHNVAQNSRGGGLIEPQVKEQWFVAVNRPFTMGPSKLPGVKAGDRVTLKSLMRTAVESGAVSIFPDRFTSAYYHWIDNLRDWCISRQIWYGHRIPVWYKNGEIRAQIDRPGEGWEQDTDTLDTWFSSGLWTFSTLGWPEQTSDLKTYHPTTVLETGHDILFFWVARMILMSAFLLGEVPFKNVYLHGLVRDEKNRKMSKSLGNIVDPLDLIKKYGADAVRLSLIIGAAPGNDVPLSEDRIRGYKHFANKLWNIARYVFTATAEANDAPPTLTAEEKARLARLTALAQAVTRDMEDFNLHLAGERLYQFVWHEFADRIIEESKPFIQGENERARRAWQYLLRAHLRIALVLLHPFMPFVTEAIWQNAPPNIGKSRDFLMVERWPV
jgi:valyl-tRNA synthetase